MKKKQPPRKLFALFGNDGEWKGTYKTFGEADCDAVGPAFRPDYEVRTYGLLSTKTIFKKEKT